MPVVAWWGVLCWGCCDFGLRVCDFGGPLIQAKGPQHLCPQKVHSSKLSSSGTRDLPLTSPPKPNEWSLLGTRPHRRGGGHYLGAGRGYGRWTCRCNGAAVPVQLEPAPELADPDFWRSAPPAAAGQPAARLRPLVSKTTLPREGRISLSLVSRFAAGTWNQGTRLRVGV